MLEVMKTREAAEYLRMHEKTLLKHAQRGLVPAKKVGGEWRFLRSELERWLQEIERPKEVSGGGTS